MFGVTQQQFHQKQESEAQPPKTTAEEEEETLKRNTDCIYFLASPLTCKKGSECEYRHSDVARVNPRDCWFWLNGNCLNPKCGFRHPPLDGLLGAQVPTPAGHYLPPSHDIATSGQIPNIPGKQAVPCVFYQNGYCLKGDLCPFMHAPYSSNNKVAQLAIATSVTESQPNKKTFSGLKKVTLEHKDSLSNVTKSVKAPAQERSVTRTDMAPSRNGIATNKTAHMHAGLKDDLPRYKATNARSAGNENSVKRAYLDQQAHLSDYQNILNGKDADEISREPSPGFDVLVDDELESDYYPNEGQFGGMRGHGRRNLNHLEDYEIGHMADYHSVGDVERDMFNDSHGYDSYDQLQRQYGREEHRVSSERGSTHPERRRYPKADGASRNEELDLRNLLTKQKRGDGLRSSVRHDSSRKDHFDDRIYRAPRGDHLAVRESVVSSRLQGRIKIPRRSTSPSNKIDSCSERETDRGSHRGNFSPERLQGRLRDRMKGRVQENLDTEERSIRSSRTKHEVRNIINESGPKFTGPKRLDELKVGRSESYEQNMNDRQLLGKRKYPKLDGAPQQVEEGASFEGPMSLSEILKRKRGVVVVESESATSPRNNGDDNHKKVEESLMPINKKTMDVFSSVPKEEAIPQRSKEELGPVPGDINRVDENVKSALGQSSLHMGTEEGMIGDEAMDDHELEADDQREGYDDYEQADDADYNLDEGENLDPEDEYYEEDDADDFAKKMGVIHEQGGE